MDSTTFPPQVEITLVYNCPMMVLNRDELRTRFLVIVSKDCLLDGDNT